MKDKKLIGVIVGRASESVQKIMLDGIISQAEKYGFDTAVISNIYNFSYLEYFASIEVENKIYELIESPRLDGIVVMAETLSESDLRPMLLEKIKNLNIPCVVAGENIDGYICVNNNIRDDFHEITRHLTEVHGFTRIDILTGQHEIPTSHERVEGVRDIMTEKGLPFSDENIIYGNFWTNSGEDVAEEYISGARQLPQAVICANDFMAYGFIDKMFEKGIKVGRDVSVIGYEYVGERYYHYPILTTYSRNRYAVGAKAVSILNNFINGAPVEDISLKGCMVTGGSCPCNSDKDFMIRELQNVRRVQFYNSMTICGNFERQLAMCRSLSDYIRTLQDYTYLIRDSCGLYLCLYENWSSLKDKSNPEKSSNDEMMTMYRLISPIEVSSEPHYFTRKMLFPDELPGAGDKKFLYFVPLFTEGIELGYLIIQYDKSDGYDTVITGWINSAVNALSMLRMKNDINQLLEYSNLSAFRDTATGIYNRAGFIRELDNAMSAADADSRAAVILIKTRAFSDEIRSDEISNSVRLDMEIAEILKNTNVNSSVICAKLADKLFAYAAVGNLSDNFHELMSDRLSVLVSHAPLYCKQKDSREIIISSITLPTAGASAEDIISTVSEDINRKTEKLENLRKSSGYSTYITIRMDIYAFPERKWDAENVCRDLHMSCGYFRAAYKNLFGVSFHQDVIRSRISLAKYLLVTTALNIPSIAQKCGYDDEKYFMRQFRQQTDISPNAYRKYEIK